jgi:hypothetical protein
MSQACGWGRLAPSLDCRCVNGHTRQTGTGIQLSYCVKLQSMFQHATKKQLRAMLKNLLAERFRLAVHHEIRELRNYSLTVMRADSSTD